MQAQTAGLTLIVLFFIADVGCTPLIDLPLSTELSQVPDVQSNEEPQATKALGEQQLSKSIPENQPLRSRNLRAGQRRQETDQRSASLGPQVKPTAHDETISVQPLSLNRQDAAGPIFSETNRLEKLNSSDRDNLSVAVSEVLLFLVVGTVFVLVHVSRRRPPASPDTPLAKLLHTRPWR